MLLDLKGPQTPAPTGCRGLLFLGAYGFLVTAGFAALTLTDTMWVFFASGTLKLAWAAGLLVLTGLWAALDWSPPAFGARWIAVGAAATALAAWWVLQGFANSADEYAYVFQAQTYLSGHLWNPAPLLGQALASDYTWVKDGIWAGQYPPGWPAVLALFGWCGWPFWLVNAVLTVGLCLALHRLDPRRLEMPLLAALSPFVIFTGASLHSHMAAALLGVMSVLCLERARRDKSWGWAMAAGMLLGGLGLVRYMSAALVALPFAVTLLAQRRWKLCVGVGVGIVPCFLLVLAYHYALTGDPLKPVYWLGGRTVDHLYFDSVGRALGLRLSLWRWVELVEWAGPGLVLLWVGMMAAKARDRSWSPADWVFPLFVLTFLFYPFDGANRYGPRYYFEALPFVLMAVRGRDLGPMARRLVGLSLVYGLVALPFLGGYYRQIVWERQDLYRQVAQQGLSHAIVLVVDGPGHLWKMEPDDMARNGLKADGPVLYARADKTDVDELRRSFPDRQVWIYRCPDTCGLYQD